MELELEPDTSKLTLTLRVDKDVHELLTRLAPYLNMTANRLAGVVLNKTGRGILPGMLAKAIEASQADVTDEE